MLHNLTEKNKFRLLEAFWVLFLIFLMIQNTFLIIRIGDLMHAMAVQGQAVLLSKDICFFAALIGTEYTFMFLLRSKLRTMDKKLNGKTP